MSRSRAAALGVALALAIGIAAAPAASAQGEAIAIGDSVMLGAKWQLQHRGIRVDAKQSRFPAAGIPALRARAHASDAVIHLGTNGQLRLADCRALVRAARAERTYLVTIKAPRDYARRNNAVIRECAASFPAGRVRVIDWAAAASQHPSWLYSDGIHLRPEGAKGFAQLIARAIAHAREAAGAASPPGA